MSKWGHSRSCIWFAVCQMINSHYSTSVVSDTVTSFYSLSWWSCDSIFCHYLLFYLPYSYSYHHSPPPWHGIFPSRWPPWSRNPCSCVDFRQEDVLLGLPSQKQEGGFILSGAQRGNEILLPNGIGGFRIQRPLYWSGHDLATRRPWQGKLTMSGSFTPKCLVMDQPVSNGQLNTRASYFWRLVLMKASTQE